MKTKVLSLLATVLFCASLMGNLNAAPSLIFNNNLNIQIQPNGIVVEVAQIEDIVVEVAQIENSITIIDGKNSKGEMFVSITQGKDLILEDAAYEGVYEFNFNNLGSGVYNLTLETSNGTNKYKITVL